MRGAAEPQEALEKLLGYRFADPALLQGALTHPSALQSGGEAARNPHRYERLEFLGDRVLGLIVAELLLARHPAENEGALTRRLTALVRREAVLAAAETIDLDRFIRTSAPAGAKERETAVADGCEALIGALYLDGGLPAAQAFVRRVWAPFLKRLAEPRRDPKTALQEWLQGRGRPLPTYDIIDRQGPAHEPVFTVEVSLSDGPSATGSGPSRREAEQTAAAALLERLKSDERG